MPLAVKLLAVTLYVHGLSMDAIAKLLQVSTPAVLKWIRTFAETHCTKPQSTATAAVIEPKNRSWITKVCISSSRT